MKGVEFSEVKALTPGRLALFAIECSTQDAKQISKQDLEWFSKLQYLSFDDYLNDEATPANMMAIAEVSKESLTHIDVFSGCNPLQTSRIYTLPKLKSLKFRLSRVEPNSVDLIDPPNPREVYASPEIDFLKSASCRNLGILSLEVAVADFGDEDLEKDVIDLQERLVYSVEDQH